MKLDYILNNLHPNLQLKLQNLVKMVEDSYDFTIEFSTAYRSKEEQDRLYEQGRSTPGAIVTNARGGYSQHNWGIAADFYIVRNSEDWKKLIYWDGDGAFGKVGKLAQSIGLGWGGNWSKFIDKPHLYLPYWGETTQGLRDRYSSFQEFMGTWNTQPSEKPVAAYTKKDFIKDVQKAIGVVVDGIAGRKTIGATPTISESVNRKHPVVKIVQKWLNMNGHYCGEEDGVFGSRTKSGVKHYQSYIGFKMPDGIMESGKRTWREIL